ncbi:hypothetical protein BZL30_5856 [Mycobacterium kansasii]|uniref:Uncharacterized protein n=1 Tax=Mycobacterium kansasii TaxID=1768 RepID=A0A1V3X154_MYCKA|nr:hypothetical protein BZL30_5856 [Mycobacterium kansasii]
MAWLRRRPRWLSITLAFVFVAELVAAAALPALRCATAGRHPQRRGSTTPASPRWSWAVAPSG